MVLSCSVYMIEDDDVVASSLSLLLEAQRYQVVRFRSADEFLLVLETLPAGCILMDFSLPGQDGISAMRELRARGYKWPVIMMTGYQAEEIAVEAARLGARAIIDKPFSMETLIHEFELLEEDSRLGSSRQYAGRRA